MEYLSSNWETIGFCIGIILGISNVITASFPSVSENKIYNFAMKILNFLAMNFGRNRNADDV